MVSFTWFTHGLFILILEVCPPCRVFEPLLRPYEDMSKTARDSTCKLTYHSPPQDPDWPKARSGFGIAKPHLRGFMQHHESRKRRIIFIKDQP